MKKCQKCVDLTMFNNSKYNISVINLYQVFLYSGVGFFTKHAERGIGMMF